jgi:prepilin-type N-terminal cleavage/methylation domain-containing protein
VTQSKTHARRGFSLIEMMVVMLVIFMLMGLLIGGFRFATSYSKRAANKAAVSSLKQAISQFEQQVGFIPPMVKDMGDPPPAGNFTGTPTRVVNGENRPFVYLTSNPADLVFLRTRPASTVADMRFSIYTYSYYLVGACDLPRTTANPVPTIDGIAGPGFLTPKRDGTFERSGKQFGAMFDVGKNARVLVTTEAAEGRVELRDPNGIAFRYYRWEHGKPTGAQMGEIVDINDLNIPEILGSPSDNEALKNAKWAILGAGPDGIFGNEDQILLESADHPQGLTIEQMVAKLGMSGNVADPNFVLRVRTRAMEDNIVVVEGAQ